MGHAVYHRTASGEAQLEDVSSLEAALELVERLRNEDGPSDVRVFKEIPVEVRTYYRVVAADEAEAPVKDDTADVAEVSSDPAADEPTEVVDEPVSDDAFDEVAALTEPDAGEEPAPVPPVASAEPPAGAMPLLSPPPPSVTVHEDSDADEPATASSGRPKLFNRG